MKVVVYYRCRPSEPEYSEAALVEQLQAVDKWQRYRRAEVDAEYFETEADGLSRPQLSQAIEACRRNNANLLIARTEAIGSGLDFSPRIVSVPVAIVEQLDRDLGYTVPTPTNAPSGMSLRFSAQPGAKNIAVYLCNRTDEALRGVRIRVTGVTSKEATGACINNGGKTLALDRIESHTAVIVDYYNVLSDGDFISVYDIEFVAALNQHVGRALIGPGMIEPKFVALKLHQELWSKFPEGSDSIP